MSSLLPYEFTDAYSGCYTDVAGAMDPRHVFIVHEILRAWPFQSALELGSYHGASSTAFVEAINAGHAMQATFCDVHPRPSLRAVLANGKRNVRLTDAPSWDVLASFDFFDFVLVDAYHDAESVAKELQCLLVRRPLCIMAHDTNATAAGYPKCEGAALLKKTIAELPGYLSQPFYHCIEDKRVRDRERTERGLFFATTDARLYEGAKQIFARWEDA